VAVGDFNGDGKRDLAVANLDSNNVSVLIGNGNGTFQGAVNYGAGTYPASVAVGDFDGDGKPDVAVANYGGGNVSVLLNDGDGTFDAHPAVNYGVGMRPYSVAVGDFNGDAKSDLAVANYDSDNVSVLIGNGNGTFQGAVNYGVGCSPRSVAAGDLNGDAKPDLAVANYCSGDVTVLLNTSIFDTTTTVTSSVNPSTHGESVTFTATVTATAGTPGGTVQFYADGAALGAPVTLASGQAAMSTSALAVGARSITVAYSGDTNYGSSTSAPYAQIVNRASPTITLTSSPHPSVVGQMVTFTASADWARMARAPSIQKSPNACPMTGTMGFKDSSTLIGTGALDANCQATFSISTLAIGDHSITAEYAGDANFTSGTSNVRTHTVSPIRVFLPWLANSATSSAR
jgi:hypothetical protein